MRSETAGCWTCRVRHRKCGLETPTCNECGDRHVQCHGYGPQPAWLDGGLEERKELSRIKAAINDNFRHLKKLQGRARQKAREQSQALSETPINEQETLDTVLTPPEASNSPSLLRELGCPARILSVEEQDTNGANDAAIEPCVDASQQTFSGDPGLDDQEACLLMHYLDRVFAWQFPYHCSQSRLGNRGWLFLLLIKRGPLYHATLSLSSLHQSAILETEEEFQQKQKALDHHSRALRELCLLLSEKGDKLLDDHSQLVDFLACSFMLISLEVFRGAEHDWLLHLDAVASLIALLSPKAIFNPQPYSSDASPRPVAGPSCSPESAANKALEFLTVAVIWYDLFACVTTGGAPRLPYQRWLQIQGVNTADLMGCENWVMVIIGDLAHFGVWKDLQDENGVLSVHEVASRGQDIKRRLENGIEVLNLAICGPTLAESQTSWVSRLFALAALVLLHTIESGPLPALPEVQSAVSRGIVTLKSKPRACSLTGVVWALCVIGCMAQEQNQSFFETLMTDLVRDSGRIGNSATVLEIMRKCWTMQETGRADCRITMSKMGIHALLI